MSGPATSDFNLQSLILPAIVGIAAGLFTGSPIVGIGGAVLTNFFPQIAQFIAQFVPGLSDLINGQQTHPLDSLETSLAGAGQPARGMLERLHEVMANPTTDGLNQFLREYNEFRTTGAGRDIAVLPTAPNLLTAIQRSDIDADTEGLQLPKWRAPDTGTDYTRIGGQSATVGTLTLGTPA